MYMCLRRVGCLGMYLVNIKMAGQQHTQTPVQCEDDTNPNHFMVVYDTESYECQSKNAKMCEQEVFDFAGQGVITWGEWFFPLVGSPVLRQAVTSGVAISTEDDGDMDPLLDIVPQTNQPFPDMSDFHNVDMECLGVNTYTDGPEDDENLDEEEGEKEDSDSDYSLIIY